jgi:hypothetical protein
MYKYFFNIRNKLWKTKLIKFSKDILKANELKILQNKKTQFLTSNKNSFS